MTIRAKWVENIIIIGYIQNRNNRLIYECILIIIIEMLIIAGKGMRMGRHMK